MAPDRKEFPQNPAFERIRRSALAHPGAYEEFPWGECAVKVNGKTFLFTRNDDSGLHVTIKLPQSREFALEYPFTQPTGYGLGRSGWVTASLAPGETPPIDILEAWIAESYRAMAPKKLLNPR